MDIFDEIIETLRVEQEYSEYSYISPDTLKQFYSSDLSEQSNVGIHKKERVYNKNSVVKTNNYHNKPEIPKGISGVVQEDNVSNRYQNSVPQVSYDQMSMEQLLKVVTDCTKCDLCRTRTNTVFGEGSYNAELMLIGEGPGRDEDMQGRPFVGRSGQLLTKMLKAMGYERDEVFIANIVKCRPPNNRNPFPNEADVCIGYLARQIDIIKPKVLLLLGAVPMKFILNKTGITRIHGQWFEYKGIKTLPTFHPSFLLRDPRQKKYAWDDLQKVMKVLGKTYAKPKTNS